MKNDFIAQGRAAWERLKSDNSWNDWVTVAETLETGRRLVCEELGIDIDSGERLGRGFNTGYSQWLNANGFGDMKDATRSWLGKIYKNLPEIERWRSKLPLNDRLKWSYPETVFKKWEASLGLKKTKPPTEKSENVTSAELVERNKELSEELESAKAKTVDWSGSAKELANQIAQCLQSNGRIDAVKILVPALQKMIEAEVKTKPVKQAASKAPVRQRKPKAA